VSFASHPTHSPPAQLSCLGVDDILLLPCSVAARCRAGGDVAGMALGVRELQEAGTAVIIVPLDGEARYPYRLAVCDIFARKVLVLSATGESPAAHSVWDATLRALLAEEVVVDPPEGDEGDGEGAVWEFEFRDYPQWALEGGIPSPLCHTLEMLLVVDTESSARRGITAFNPAASSPLALLQHACTLLQQYALRPPPVAELAGAEAGAELGGQEPGGPWVESTGLITLLIASLAYPS
jgi:hypothetical protein